MMVNYQRKEYIMTGKKTEIIIPSLEEDAIINAQIAADPDDFEWDEETFANAVTTPELLALNPQYSKLPQFANIKPAESISVGIDPDIARHFEKSGGGWKRRLNQTLREAVFGSSKTEK